MSGGMTNIPELRGNLWSSYRKYQKWNICSKDKYSCMYWALAELLIFRETGGTMIEKPGEKSLATTSTTLNLENIEDASCSVTGSAQCQLKAGEENACVCVCVPSLQIGGSCWVPSEHASLSLFHSSFTSPAHPSSLRTSRKTLLCCEIDSFYQTSCLSLGMS